jgi:sortase A
MGATLVWGDPFTSLYTRHEQHLLGQQLDRIDRSWRRPVPNVRRNMSAARAQAAVAAQLAASARLYRRGLRDGAPIGRIRIPRLHLEMVVVQGTSESDLAKGPGHYDTASGVNTSLPGLGGVIGIAGHRTTFLHPFMHIDELQPGDNVYLQMPYGTFRYRVYYHKVVAADDWSILRPRPYEKLVLSACHPLYSASHRWVVFARLQGHSGTPA